MQHLTLKDLHTEKPRWCVGCGNYGILLALKRFLIDKQIMPHKTVNISGIGCSGRTPNYMNTYGVHAIHGRPITIAFGLALAQEDLKIIIHSGDGDALSIGGNHLIHGINRNFNCIFLLYDNQTYALTKNQTSPTTPKEHRTNTNPMGSLIEPLNSIRIALGIGGSFVASTADWMSDHIYNTIKAAYEHRGFSFIHVFQRCSYYHSHDFDHETTKGFAFLKHKNGIQPDKLISAKAEIIEHDPSDLQTAFQLANDEKKYLGLFFQNFNKPCYDEILHNQIRATEQKPYPSLLDQYKI